MQCAVFGSALLKSNTSRKKCPLRDSLLERKLNSNKNKNWVNRPQRYAEISCFILCVFVYECFLCVPLLPSQRSWCHFSEGCEMVFRVFTRAKYCWVWWITTDTRSAPSKWPFFFLQHAPWYTLSVCVEGTHNYADNLIQYLKIRRLKSSKWTNMWNSITQINIADSVSQVPALIPHLHGEHFGL